MTSVCVFFLFLALVFLFDILLTLALQWALAAFAINAPFWPLFALVVIVSMIFGRSSK